MSNLVRLALVLLVCGLAPAQTRDFTELERSAAAEITKLNIPGASIAIVRGTSIVYSKGVGLASVETNEPVRPEMLFRLGSTTKMFTASALAGLAVEGKIDLNAPIGKYLNFLPPRLAQITANQLLSHTSGLRDDAPMYGTHDDSGLGSGIRGWTDAWLFTAPASVYSYSNPGYWMVGYLVETLTATPYAEAMETRVFKPLGMTRTTLRPTMAMTYPLAQGHEYSDGKLHIARPAADNTASWPAGSIFSNTHDLAQFTIAFMNDGRIDGRQVLDPKVIALMSSPHAKVPSAPDLPHSYGYGLELDQFRGVRVIQHGGSRTGYGSQIRMMPDQHVAIIVQTNRSGATLPATMLLATEMMVKLTPKPPAAQETAVSMNAQDLARLPGEYRNGEQSVEIIARDNQLFVKLGRAPETQLVKRGDTQFSAGDARLIVIAAADGSIAYLHASERAFARVH